MATLKNTQSTSTSADRLGSQGNNQNGFFRYSTANDNLEVYQNGSWQSFFLGNKPQIFGSGSAGNATVSGSINQYSHMTDSSRSANENVMNVDSTSGMSTGDWVFIHQTQEYAATWEVGNYEINEIESINGNTITFARKFRNRYLSGSYNTTNQTSRVTQLVTCPQYNILTLNGLLEAEQWNGQSGGILFVVANQVDCNGNYISAFGRGYRGGRGNGNSGDKSTGYAGESIRGHLNSSDNRNDTGGAGAGGTTNSGGDSGGSGAHATSGGRGSDGGVNPEGGNLLGYAHSLSHQMVFGGGGGRGGDNDDASFGDPHAWADLDTGAERSESDWSLLSDFTSFVPPWGSNRHSSNPDASHGGGIVVIVSPTIVNLRVTCRGRPGIGGSSVGERSGAGAAGSVYIKTQSGNVSIDDIDVRGAASGSLDGDLVGPSGDGRVRIEVYNGSSITEQSNIKVGNGDLTISTRTG